MPPKIQEILNDRKMLAIIGGSIALLLVIGFFLMMMMGGGKKGDPGDKELAKNDLLLANASTLGRAIEIQALLAREQLHVELNAAPGNEKVQILFPEKTRQGDRDRAVIALVQSGLMDSNVGLESFDKGDLTASREEKRIKLIRAQQGELARLIKKIDPIEDAAVSIAIPEPSIFRADEKPVTASVQVSVPAGTILTHDQVRAIDNLVIGSIQGLDQKHLSVSDTNGHTYTSILDSGADMADTLHEQDSYMRQKVVAQLDRLLGAGNYTVTVSTELRQAPRETMVEQYDPQGAVLSNKQSFNENLNNRGTQAAAGPASIVLPPGLENSATQSGQQQPIPGSNQQPAGKDYLRNGVEVNYRNSKTQWLETSPTGMVEDISVAVTIDSSHYPDAINSNDLQTLIARAASPKVRPENVSIARTDMRTGLPMGEGGTNDRSEQGSGADSNKPPESPSDMSWIYWAGGAVLLCAMAIVGLNFFRKPDRMNPLDETFLQSQHEMQQLRELALQQQEQLQMTQQQTQMLMEAQQRQLEQTMALETSLSRGGLGSQMGQGAYPNNPNPGNADLQRTLDELRETVIDEDERDEQGLDLQIQNWIESV